MECPWCAMEIEKGTEVCPYCKSRVVVSSRGRNRLFTVIAVIALAGFTALMLEDALRGLLNRFLP